MGGVLIPFNAMIAVTQYYTCNNPTSPEPQIGDVVAIQADHGRTVYVTYAEATWLHVTYALVAIGTGSFAIYVIARVLKAKLDSGFLRS